MPSKQLIIDTFKKYDKDNSGYLDLNEVKIALKDLASSDQSSNSSDVSYNIDPTDAEIKNIIMSVDDNDDCKLSLEEFHNLIDAINSTGEEVRKQFEFFDKDGNGQISKKELKKSLKQLNQKISKCQLKRMIKEADLNGDGQVSFEEFQRILISEAMIGR